MARYAHGRAQAHAHTQPLTHRHTHTLAELSALKYWHNSLQYPDGSELYFFLFLMTRRLYLSVGVRACVRIVLHLCTPVCNSASHQLSLRPCLSYFHPSLTAQSLASCSKLTVDFTTGLYNPWVEPGLPLQRFPLSP